MRQGLAVLGGVIAIMAIIIGVIVAGAAKRPAPNRPPAGSAAAPAPTTRTTADGLAITDQVVGTGPAATAGSTVTVDYTGRLANGTVFDSTASHGGQPATFPLSGVIKGWQEGIPGMRVGGTRTLVIPPALAYGNQAVGSIPPGSTLTFEIKLLAVKP